LTHRQLQLDEKTWEAMESCRPGVDDLSDPAMLHLAAQFKVNPEFAKLYNRIEQIDVKVGAAFYDVTVPPELAQRILGRLVQPQVQGRKSKISRRWMCLAAGLISTAAILFVALWMNLYNAQCYSEQTVLDEAIQYFDADSGEEGFLLAEKAPPNAYPFSRTVSFSNGIRWREIHDFMGRSGIAYYLPTHNGVRATLYVTAQTIEGLGSEPRLHPFTTSGCSTSAWQEGGLLYVLVVQGEPRTYQNYLDLPRGPVA
jgi:hypothetical protein